MRLYLRKNDTSQNDKIPYFTLSVPPEKGSGEDWKEVAVFWKAKSGKGYNGLVSAGAIVDVSQVKSWKEKKNKEADQAFDDVQIDEPKDD